MIVNYLRFARVWTCEICVKSVEDCSICKEVASTPVKLEDSEKSQVKLEEWTPLQDFCVADTDSSVRVNGFVCRNPMMAQASDFSLTGLNLPGDTSNPLGSAITPATVAQIPGLNTLGISMVRIDYAPWGLNPPHIHPRATKIFTVLEGTLEVGFVTSNLENRFISKVL
ncbi:hypothetical protein TEA_005409 [Camellia sinensis var. sinensis]|uniref:Cupin type-1 domain-containing protein n=1 Tax=Camellia sinensis var. sinensis TaxID=542762 RepID=A0A4S4DB34_CAMSN|nr:hypothetical protein TEA_005409 [Camellia sinensis var. sinensis]